MCHSLFFVLSWSHHDHTPMINPIQIKQKNEGLFLSRVIPIIHGIPAISYLIIIRYPLQPARFCPITTKRSTQQQPFKNKHKWFSFNFYELFEPSHAHPRCTPAGLRTRENTFPFSVRAVRRSRKTRGHWLRQDDPPPPDECADRGGGGGWLSRGGRARRRDNGVDTASERGEWWRARNARNLQRPSCAPWGAKTRWTVKVDLLSGLLDSLSLSVSLSLDADPDQATN